MNKERLPKRQKRNHVADCTFTFTTDGGGHGTDGEADPTTFTTSASSVRDAGETQGASTGDVCDSEATDDAGPAEFCELGRGGGGACAAGVWRERCVPGAGEECGRRRQGGVGGDVCDCCGREHRGGGE